MVFAGDSLEFLVDLHSRADTLAVTPPPARVPTTSKHAQALIADQRVLFLTYGVLRTLLACGALHASQIALLILDNVMEADDVVSALNSGADSTTANFVLPKVCVCVLG